MRILFFLFTLTLIAPSVFGLNPSRTYKQLPDKFNMEYEVHKVRTQDGAKLNAWSFKAKGAKTTRLILISHNGEGNMADYLRRVDQFTSMGYNVVTYDYRGYGESSEFEIDNNMFIYPHFQDDFKAMMDFCRKTHVATFDLYGWGIGGGLSLGIGWNRRETKKIIADTPFFSMEDLETRFEEWDEPMEVPFAGYEKNNEPKYALQQRPTEHITGVLLIIGSNDILMNADELKTLQTPNKKIVGKPYVVENPDRKDNFRAATAEYVKTVSAFLFPE